MTSQELLDAKNRLFEIDFQLAGLSKGNEKRTILVQEKLKLEHAIHSEREARQATERNRRPPEKSSRGFRIARTPTGASKPIIEVMPPYCEFCGNHVEAGKCTLAGPNYPHAPGL